MISERSNLMKRFLNRFGFPRSRTFRELLCLCFLLSLERAQAQPTIVTEPLMRYGLGRLECAAYSPNPDVPLIATGGGIGAVIWNAETGEQVRILVAAGHFVMSVAFSPDGAQVLTGSFDNTMKLWDVSSAVELRTFSGHRDRVISVVVSPDGAKALTGSNDDTAKVWDVATGLTLLTFSGHSGSVRCVAFSSDGATALTGSGDKTAILWNTETGAVIQTFSGHTDTVSAVALSPDGPDWR